MEITRQEAFIILTLMQEVATGLSDLSEDEVTLYQKIIDKYDFISDLE